MTKQVEYYGDANFKEYDANDFKKAGLEGQKKVVFQPGIAVELPDEVVDALTSKDGLFGDDFFREVEEPETGLEPLTPAESNKEAAKAKKGAASKDVPDVPGATPQEDVSSTPGTGSTTTQA